MTDTDPQSQAPTTPRRGRPPLQFDREDAIRRIAAGATAEEVAVALNVHQSAIDREVRSRGGIAAIRDHIPPARRVAAQRNEALRAQIRELLAAGKTYAEVARATKLTRQRVWQLHREMQEESRQTEAAAKARELLASGKTDKEVAKATKLKIAVVRSLRREALRPNPQPAGHP